ncbi:DUF2786 domain-containing protein [Paenalcaligenes suwonensis]|uniref:DUF2786 domain-containing protein n=1 Tax=Paenalcaligenes suwonensis TaxID=1202713 RepID=UPI00140A330A|nr:DUF2786 domain-containing protein [Paenalcaligenes suwonensis]NHC62738.1 DUF2786 domain-containing protein [Paenalcaligenes suwonensis]
MTENDDNRSRYVERIRKLLALAGSSNEHEAAIARKRADAMMEKYSITYMELGEAEFGSGDFETATKDHAKWKVDLYTSIGFIFGCQIAYYTNLNQKMAVTFYGKKPMVEIALYISDVISRAQAKAWDEHKQLLKRHNITTTDTARNTFHEAFASGVITTVRNIYLSMSADERNMHLAEIDGANHLTENIPTRKSRESKPKERDALALAAGYLAGKAQNINIGVGTAAPNARVTTDATTHPA